MNIEEKLDNILTEVLRIRILKESESKDAQVQGESLLGPLSEMLMNEALAEKKFTDIKKKYEELVTEHRALVETMKRLTAIRKINITEENKVTEISLSDNSQILEEMLEGIRFIKDLMPTKADLVQIGKIRNQKELVKSGVVRPAAKYDTETIVKMFTEGAMTSYKIAKVLGCSVWCVDDHLIFKGLKPPRPVKDILE